MMINSTYPTTAMAAPGSAFRRQTSSPQDQQRARASSYGSGNGSFQAVPHASRWGDPKAYNNNHNHHSHPQPQQPSRRKHPPHPSSQKSQYSTTTTSASAYPPSSLSQRPPNVAEEAAEAVTTKKKRRSWVFRRDKSSSKLPVDAVNDQQTIMDQIKKSRNSKSNKSLLSRKNSSSSFSRKNSSSSYDSGRILAKQKSDAKIASSGLPWEDTTTRREHKQNSSREFFANAANSDNANGAPPSPSSTKLPAEVHPHKQVMKQDRKAKIAGAATTGAIVGGVLTGPVWPVGMVAGAAIGSYASKVTARAGERRQQRKWERDKFDEYANSKGTDWAQSESVTFA